MKINKNRIYWWQKISTWVALRVRDWVAISYHFTVIMVDSVKAFRFFKKCLQIIGILPAPQDGKRRSINLRETIILFGNTLAVLPTVAYLVLEGESIFDYGMGLCMSVCLINGAVVHFLLIWKSERIFKFIESCEEFITNSECKSYIVVIEFHQPFVFEQGRIQERHIKKQPIKSNCSINIFALLWLPRL